jgi:serine/threonine protein phosphatase PrpC
VLPPGTRCCAGGSRRRGLADLPPGLRHQVIGSLVRLADDPRRLLVRLLAKLVGGGDELDRGSQTQPTVTRFDMTWGHVLLLCSDGLTRHVSDDRIRDALRSMTSARQACETLLQNALDGGGGDNITVVVGRAMQWDAEAS